MTVGNEFRAVRGYQLHETPLAPVLFLLEHSDGIHRYDGVATLAAFLRMMKQIRLQGTLRALRECRVLPSVLSRLPLAVFVAQARFVAPCLEEVGEVEIGILLAHLYGNGKHARIDERRLLLAQLHVSGKQHACLFRTNRLVVLAQIAVYRPVCLLRVLGTVGYGFYELVPSGNLCRGVSSHLYVLWQISLIFR